MQENQYDEMLTQLREGKIENLEVSQNDFLIFREAWLKQPDKNNFIGVAELGGRVIYSYQQPVQ